MPVSVKSMHRLHLLGALIGMRCFHPRLIGVYVLLHLLIRRAIVPGGFTRTGGGATAHAASNSTRSQKITSALNSIRYGVGRSYAYQHPYRETATSLPPIPRALACAVGQRSAVAAARSPALRAGATARAIYRPAKPA